MLVLSRLEGEAIVIGQDVKVVVLSIQGGGRVRLGIEAPKEVPVHRQEVFEKIRKEAKF